MRHFIRHYVPSGLDEEGIQRCIFCGAIISDYRNMISPAGTPPPKGFDEGYVYISKGNPTITTTVEPDSFVICEP